MKIFFKISFLSLIFINIVHAECNNGINSADIDYMYFAKPMHPGDVETHKAYSLVHIKNEPKFKHYDATPLNENGFIFLNRECYGFVGTHVSQLPNGCRFILIKTVNARRVHCTCANTGCNE